MNRRNIQQPWIVLHRVRFLLWCLFYAGIAGIPIDAQAEADDFERPPINYSSAVAENPVSALQDRLAKGELRLNHESHLGYLASVLRELQVPVSSQTLVFSKTSLQRNRIAPRTPRAIYFNDETYIGFCQNGEVLEVSTADPNLGTVFYMLSQEKVDSPQFVRQNDNCLVCHASSMTRGVPGHLVRSVYVDASGQPILSRGTHRIDHTSPINTRWGGWYVTGTHGGQTHLGNLVVTSSDRDADVDLAPGQNLTDLSERFKTARYLSPHSDLVALMVLEHQVEGHNLLTRANFETREALFSEQRLNQELNEPEGHRWQSTTTRIKSTTEALVKYLLFSGEATLTAPVRGTSAFQDEFAQRGRRDARGRSLRDFDLEHRLFKYPCSYLIYTPSFDALPEEAKTRVYHRLFEVLSGTDQSREFAHLSPEDRTAILEILRETKPGLPAEWTAAQPPVQ